jgi:WD40 repeat protein
MSATPSNTPEIRPTSAPPAQSTRQAGKRANVFICFAPEERDFARDLDNELRKRRRISAIDWLKADATTTSAGPDVFQRIEAADTFVFVVSPSSLASEVCRKQLEHAARLRKSIVSVLRVEVATENLLAPLASLTIIDYRAEVNREKAFEEVIKAVNTNLRIDVFICYARADKDFVKKLYDEMVKTGRSVWLDVSNILTSAIWKKEIYSGIEAADNFIFIISPDSLRIDSYCHNEFAHAHNNNKRIIPLYYREAEPSLIPAALAQYQHRDFSQGGNFERDFQALEADLDKDPVYVREHTRLLTRAKEWERSGDEEDNRDKSLLLRGNDLTRAEQLRRTADDKEQKFTNLQTQYIDFSRTASNRSRNYLRIGVTTALAIMLVLTIFLFFQTKAAEAAQLTAEGERKTAEEQRAEATTQRDLAQTATKDAMSQQIIAVIQRTIASTRENEAVESARKAEQRRLEAERERKRAVAAAEAERRAREIAEIRGLRAEASVLEATGKPLDALALHRAATEMEQKAGSPASSNDIERLAKQIPLSRVSASHPNGVIDNLTVSSDGKTLATAARAGDISVWDVTTGTRRKTLPAAARNMSALVFSPGEKNLLASVSHDKDNKHVATLWNVETGAAKVIELQGGLFILNGKPASDRNPQFSDDGQLLIVGSVIIDSQTELAVGMKINGREITSSALSHKKKLVALTFNQMRGDAPDSPTAALYDAATGEFLRPLLGPAPARGEAAAGFGAIAFSHDDSLIAAATSNNSLRIWKVDSGQAVEVSRPDIRVRQLVFSPNNNGLVTTDSFYRLGRPGGPWTARSTISVWNAVTGTLVNVKERLPAHDEAITSLLFSSDGERFATSSVDGAATIWDAREWVNLQTLKSHQDVVNTLAFVPNSHDLVTASEDGTARVWHYLERFTSHKLEITEEDKSLKPSNIVAFSHDATRAVRGVSMTDAPPSERVGIAIYDTETKKLIGLVKGLTKLEAIAFSDDATRLAELNDRAVRVWEISSGKSLGSVEGSPCEGVCFPRTAYSGNLMTVAHTNQSQVIVKDLDGNHSPLSFQVKGFQGMGEAFRAKSLALSPDGMQFAVAFNDGSERGKLILWKRVAGQFQLQKSFDVAPNRKMAFTRDGQLLVMGGEDRSISVLDTTTLKVSSPRDARYNNLIDVIVCAREAPVCATSSNYGKSVQVWRAASDFGLITSVEPGGTISHIVLSADGSRLITTPQRQSTVVSTMHVWNTSNGDLIDSIKVNRWPGFAPVFFPDSRRIALADATSNEFNIWDTQPFGQDTLRELGSRINMRVCRETHRVVPVFPFPPQDTVWAPPELCK